MSEALSFCPALNFPTLIRPLRRSRARSHRRVVWRETVHLVRVAPHRRAEQEGHEDGDGEEVAAPQVHGADQLAVADGDADRVDVERRSCRETAEHQQRRDAVGPPLGAAEACDAAAARW